jgi:hypothetical protein
MEPQAKINSTRKEDNNAENLQSRVEIKLLINGHIFLKDQKGTLATHLHRFLRTHCSVSRWRPQKVDKCMVLEYTHGLFIT